MRKILAIIIFSFFGCDNQASDRFCIDYILNIESLENEIERLFQKEGELKEELENAKLYIQTLELENSLLIEMKNK